MSYTPTSLSRLIWCRIRFFQSLNEVSNEKLAKTLGVMPRTLYTYDKTAGNITLNQLESFIDEYSLSIEQLISN